MQGLTRRFKRWLRRSETGQSVILLALAFIALAGFIGITTDISVMFVRYAQLSRAVDSAAIAAANQWRQNEDGSQSQIFANMGMAARQFIEFHGLNSQTVIVDNCDTATISNNNPQEICIEGQESKQVRVQAHIKSPTIFMRLIGVQDFDLWASAVSQTASLDVVLIMDVSESMLRYTTYEDWAAIEEITGDERDQFVRQNLGVIYRPPLDAEIETDLSISKQQLYVDGYNDTNYDSHPVYFGDIPGMLTDAQIQVNNRLTYMNRLGSADIHPNASDDAPENERMAEYKVLSDNSFFADARFPAANYDYNDVQDHPREDCRVRFNPQAWNNALDTFYAYRDPSTGQLVDLKTTYNNINSGWWPAGQDSFAGFQPAYNFYGCCNDPDGDGAFEDLTCQPFKQARDATFDFLKRIDFTNGDRVGFVTFDRSAFLINPYGEAEDGFGNVLLDADGNAFREAPMLGRDDVAFATLRDLIGVRAEPNFYRYEVGTYIASDSVEDEQYSLVSGWRPNEFAIGVDQNGASIPIDYTNDRGFDPTNLPDIAAGPQPHHYNFPVYSNCPFRNAAETRTDRTLFYRGMDVAIPSGLSPLGLAHPEAKYHTQPGDVWSSWKNYTSGGIPLVLPNDQVFSYLTYELWASCRGTNIGAALREGNNALANPLWTRPFGTVWIMILLSDGGAGASDPVRRNATPLLQADPYQITDDTKLWDLDDNPWGSPGEYGAFGLCPFGRPTAPGELVDVAGEPGVGVFPFCSDESPKTRHKCDFRPLVAAEAGDSDLMRDINNQLYDIDLSQTNGYDCPDPYYYDVDDYARDWADFIGLEELSGENVLLPTIFTIGFGLEFSDSAGLSDNERLQNDNAEVLCAANPGDCLGEQLLRYIADVGDNNAIDNDFYQDWLDGALDGEAEDGFGNRGPCQRSDQAHAGGTYNYDGGDYFEDEWVAAYGQIAPRTSCGNYFYAPDGNELQFVFDEIASRMFTRLTR